MLISSSILNFRIIYYIVILSYFLQWCKTKLQEPRKHYIVPEFLTFITYLYSDKNYYLIILGSIQPTHSICNFYCACH